MEKKAEQFLALAEELPTFPIRPISNLGMPLHEVSLIQWREIVRSNFPDLLPTAEIALSLAAQLLIQDIRNPSALIFVDRPSSGKTIVINFFDGLEGLTHTSDVFTPAAFVSNIAGKSEKALEKIDLLPRIRFKMLLIRDLAPLFGDHDDKLREKFSLLTTVLDGNGLETDSGTHGHRGYKGDYIFMFLGAAPSIPLRVWKVIGGCGHRLFFLGMNSRDPEEEELVNMLNGDNYKTKEHRCRLATHNFLKALWQKRPEGILWEKKRDDKAALHTIAKLSSFLAKHRGTIMVWQDPDTKEISHSEPQIEVPKRIAETLYNYCRGHAAICDRNYIINDDLPIILPICLDTAPSPRPAIIRELLRQQGEISYFDIMRILDCSKQTAMKEMKKLIILGVCEGNVVEKESYDEETGISLNPSGRSFVRLSPKLEWMYELYATRT